MPEIKVGDIVARKSYGYDTYFKVSDVRIKSNGEKTLTIRGIDFRIEADSPETDLKVFSQDELKQTTKKIKKGTQRIKEKSSASLSKSPHRGYGSFMKTGKILHIDGAKDYIEKCKEYYKGIAVEAVVIDIPEKDQSLKIYELLEQHKPDILVLTGHDGMVKGNDDFNNMQNYRNSIHFVNAVKEARKYNESLDQLVIFAGACQSNYEAILAAGANYASSPKRIFIHMFDPAAVASKVSLKGIDKVLSINEAVADTNKGFDGVGGFETWGKARNGAPKGTY